MRAARRASAMRSSSATAASASGRPLFTEHDIPFIAAEFRCRDRDPRPPRRRRVYYGDAANPPFLEYLRAARGRAVVITIQRARRSTGWSTRSARCAAM